MNQTNMTKNITETISNTDIHTEGIKAVTAFVCLIILLLGVIGNSLVLIVFGSRFARLKSFEIYLISLAAADLLASIMIPSKMLYELVGGTFYHGGVLGCTVIACICTSSITISCLTLVVISLNRYIVVKWPLHERRSNFSLLCVILGTWIMGITLASGIYLTEGRVTLARAEKVIVCSMNFTTHAEFRLYGATLFITQSGIPLLSMSILYGLIIYELKKTARHNFFQNREHMLNNIYQRNKKSIRLLIALLVVFFICTTPEKVFYVIYTFEIQSMDPVQSNLIYTLLTLLLMVNNCINPIVYAKLHTSFRRHTLNLFCKCKYIKWNDIRDGFQSVIARNNQSFLTVNYSVHSRFNYQGTSSNSTASINTIIDKRRISAPSCSESVMGSIQKQLGTLLEHDDSALVETNV